MKTAMLWPLAAWLLCQWGIAADSAIRITCGQWTTEDDLKTEVMNISIVAGDDIAGYVPEKDADLYAYWKAEDRYWQG